MNIVFVGTPGTPYSQRACDVRLAAFANMIAKGNEVTILNRYSKKINKEDLELDEKVSVKEIISKKSFAHKFWFILSLLFEPFSILKLNHTKKIDVLHVYSGHYLDFVFYRIIANVIGAKVVYQYVEYRTDKGARNIYHRWNAKKCDFQGAKLWDGVISISDFLTEHSLKINSNLKHVKITPVCDFSKFLTITPSKRNPYLLFCGNVGYKSVVNLIVDSYRSSKIRENFDLILVLGGKKQDVNTFIDNNRDIIVLNGLKYEVLISLYKGAEGLLIPLRDTIEDKARFPNKICEYLASHGLIITTKYGEMQNYFIDGYNAIVAGDFSSEALTEKLDWLSDHSEDVEILKTNAYKGLWEVFDQNSNAAKVNFFLKELF